MERLRECGLYVPCAHARAMAIFVSLKVLDDMEDHDDDESVKVWCDAIDMPQHAFVRLEHEFCQKLSWRLLVFDDIGLDTVGTEGNPSVAALEATIPHLGTSSTSSTPLFRLLFDKYRAWFFREGAPLAAKEHGDEEAELEANALQLISREDLETLHVAFSRVDAQGTGTITLAQLPAAFDEVMVQVSEQEMRKILAHLRKSSRPGEPFTCAEFSQAADFLARARQLEEEKSEEEELPQEQMVAEGVDRNETIVPNDSFPCNLQPAQKSGLDEPKPESTLDEPLDGSFNSGTFNSGTFNSVLEPNLNVGKSRAACRAEKNSDAKHPFLTMLTGMAHERAVALESQKT